MLQIVILNLGAEGCVRGRERPVTNQISSPSEARTKDPDQTLARMATLDRWRKVSAKTGWRPHANTYDVPTMKTLSLLTSPQAVIDAIDECDKLGRAEFLGKYGYKHSRLYLLKYNGRVYDSKAIAGVAFGKQHGTPLKAKDFSGGLATVVPALKLLGFDLLMGRHQRRGQLSRHDPRYRKG